MRHLQDWVARCGDCAMECSALADAVVNGQADFGWTENTFASLEALRLANAMRTLGLLARHTELENLALLDVGCAAGWFLDIARNRGMRTEGIEPNPDAAALARAKGHDVHDSTFPLPAIPDASLDAVSFNDVFEHLPDPLAALAEVRRVLRPGGFLVLAMPDSDGIFYRLARLSALRLGATGPYERMWQRGYQSPHLFYVNKANLAMLCARAGFRLVDERRLPSIALAGLWTRLRTGRSANLAVSSVMYAGIAATYPLIRYVLPSDILLQIHRVEPV